MFFNVSFKCFSTKVASQAWKILLFIYCLSIAILQNTDLIKMRLGVLNGMRMAPLMVTFLHYTGGGGAVGIGNIQLTHQFLQKDVFY